MQKNRKKNKIENKNEMKIKQNKIDCQTVVN